MKQAPDNQAADNHQYYPECRIAHLPTAITARGYRSLFRALSLGESYPGSTTILWDKLNAD